MEPPEWDGKTDSPTAMSSSIRQLIAMGKAEVIEGDLYLEVDDVISIPRGYLYSLPLWKRVWS